MMEPYEELEHRWAQFNALDPKNMVVCSTGSAALHLALETLEAKYNYAIIPDFSMIACARACTMAGLVPKFADCDKNLLLRMGTVSRCNLNRVIMPVHIYGRQCDMNSVHVYAVMNSASRLEVIEDLAEAHGVRPHPSSYAACWSFYRNKIVAGEEGGAIWFRDQERAIVARRLRNMGFTEKHDFRHVPRGWNYRMSNANASLILDSLEQAHQNIAKRAEIEAWYDKYIPQEYKQPERSVCWVYDVRVQGMTKVQQDALVDGLNREGVFARHAFYPLSRQLEYSSSYAGNRDALLASREVIYFGVRPGIDTEGTVRRSVGLFLELLAQQRGLPVLGTPYK